MSEENKKSEGKKVLSLSGSKKLEVSKIMDAGSVRQSFSHGRTKQVAVEVKRKRVLDKGRSTGGDENLNTAEKEARLKALQSAMSRQGEAKPDTARDAIRQREVEQLEAFKAKKEEDERRKQEAEEKAKRDAEEAKKEKEAKKVEPKTSAPDPAQPEAPVEGRVVDKKARKERTEAERPAPAPKKGGGGAAKRRQKLTISQALSGMEGGERQRSVAAMRRRVEKERQKQAASAAGAEAKRIVREVTIPETITVGELANRMAEPGAEVVKSLMKSGVMATITQSIDADTAELIVEEFGHKVKRVSESDVEIGLSGEEDKPEDMTPRPPVVTVMGHVDHGKTSLLDALRKSDVVSREAGGITQHIGAYQITMESGEKITFIDTPGHAAFTEMRARGANVTDVVVLVVAADDGLMPQTIEAINHAKAADVPIIVAINKCDLPAAETNKVKQELLQHELVIEEFSGDVLCAEVSAKTGQGLDQLKEQILLQSEVLELMANPNRSAEGVVVESKMEKGRGSVATVLVRRGTLRKGDIFIAGEEWGRVRLLLNDRGEEVVEAIPGMPVEVLGLNGTPLAGNELFVVDSENRAREITEYRSRKERERLAAAQRKSTMDKMFDSIKEGEMQELPIVIKGDVHGSVEAISGALEKLSEDNEEVRVRVLQSSVGPINESDVTLANASHALIVGFNVRANAQAREVAKRDNVDIRYYSVIYDVIDDVKKALSGLLSPEVRETYIGNAEIREVFNVSKVGKVAGCMITEGVVKRGAGVRLLRDDVVVHEGRLKTLKRFKDEVKEVGKGMECGMAFENYDDIKAGDVIECFTTEEVAREL